MQSLRRHVMILGLCLGCGVSPTRESPEQPPAQHVEHTNANATRNGPPPTKVEEARPTVTSCADRNLEFETESQKLFSERSCSFSVECAVLTTAFEALAHEYCPAIREAGCKSEGASCESEKALICKAGRCEVALPSAELDEVIVPGENKVGIDPPPRPPVGDAALRANRLLDAIVSDDPMLAADFFFPQEAFRKVKAIAKPDRYWRKLFARYEKDIHALHEQLGATKPGNVQFERLELTRRGGFTRRGEEGNALPYWVARHNWLHFSRAGKSEKIEVRVLITWGDRWYITHLSEFH